MASSPVARITPVLREGSVDEDIFLPKPEDKFERNDMTLKCEKTKRESTLIKYLLVCLLFIFLLVVMVIFLSLKLSTGLGTRHKCEVFNLTETECFSCGSYGIPGVRTVQRSANDVCCVAMSDFEPIRAQVAAGFPIQKSSSPKDIKIPKKQSYRRLPSAHLHLNLTATKLRADGILVWQTSQFDEVYYIHGALYPFDNGTVRVRSSGVYRITVHVCLDAVNNPMKKENRTKENLVLCIVKKSNLVAHRDKTTLLKGTYSSQTLNMNLKLRQNEYFYIISTWRLLYKLGVCNSLDIVMIDG